VPFQNFGPGSGEDVPHYADMLGQFMLMLVEFVQTAKFKFAKPGHSWEKSEHFSSFPTQIELHCCISRLMFYNTANL